MKKLIMYRVFIVLLLVAAVIATSCAQDISQPPEPPAPPSPGAPSSPPSVETYRTPVIKLFEASPSSIVAGSTSQLVWEVTNADSVNISPNIGQVSVKGSGPVMPPTTTTYKISATNEYGSSTATTQVIVTGNVQPGSPSSFRLPVVTVFRAEPANIEMGGKATLKWEVQDSFDVEISPGLTIIPPKGSKEVEPAFTTTYKLIANNNNGSILATTTLTVSGVRPNEETPVIKHFTATPYVIKRGESSLLSWESVEGSSATIDKGVGIVDGSGTVTVQPSETTTYMLTVVNPRGGQFQTTTVNVR